ncbi:probable glutamate receptor [Centruroides sculpturatus]|uniref:probable glutamate receptor n=1 Tax=Centruroides sculpturatus TaxID=218467 RepID=UPI000C6EA20A|nr:probable glutamate receptor [Centruroides sculpturatus]
MEIMLFMMFLFSVTRDHNHSYVWRISGIEISKYMKYDGTKTQITGGKYFLLFKVIHDKLRFSYRVVHPIANHIGYVKLNDTWTGVIGQVINQEADIAFVPTGITYDLFSAMRFSSTLRFSEHVFIITVPDKVSDWNSLMKPFSLDVWIAVFSTVLILGLSLHIIVKKDLIVAKNKKLWTRCRIFWDLFCTLFGQGFDIQNIESFASRFIIGIWWLSIIVLLYAYSGTLMSFMACPITESYPKDFHELATFVRNGEYSCGSNEGLSVWKGIKESKSKDTKILRENILSDNNLMTVPQAIKKVQSERFAYIVSQYVINQYISKLKKNKYIMSTDSLYTFIIAFPICRNFFFKKAISNT